MTVSYEDAGSGTATAGTGGARGVDYVAIAPGTLTFAPGTTEQTIEVAVISDAEDEPDETVVVRLCSPVNATLAAGPGVGAIADDDLGLTFGDAGKQPRPCDQARNFDTTS